jgi:hypothetical protein
MTLPNLPMLAYAALAAIGIAGAAGVAGYRAGHQAAVTEAQAEQAGHLRRAIAEAEAIAEQDRALLASHEAAQVRVRTIFQTIEKEALRYVALHVTDADCMDADGLRLWNAANRGPDADAAAEPAHTLSAPAHAGIGEGARSLDQSHPGRPGLPRVPNAPWGLGGLGQPHWGWQ